MALFVLFFAWPGGQVDPNAKTTFLEIKYDCGDVRGANRPLAMRGLCR
jgi:hypothetical protein